MAETSRRPIALVGLMGAGKSAVARALGERLGASVADLDDMVEAVEGVSVAEVFAREGEPWFRRRERELLDQVVRSGVRVIACGGGVVLDAASRALLAASCRTVWLQVSPAEAARRVAATPGDPARVRPLLAGGDPALRLAALLAERSALYAEAADVRVPTDGRTPAEVAEAIVNDVAGGAG